MRPRPSPRPHLGLTSSPHRLPARTDNPLPGGAARGPGRAWARRHSRACGGRRESAGRGGQGGRAVPGRPPLPRLRPGRPLPGTGPETLAGGLPACPASPGRAPHRRRGTSWARPAGPAPPSGRRRLPLGEGLRGPPPLPPPTPRFSAAGGSRLPGNRHSPPRGRGTGPPPARGGGAEGEAGSPRRPAGRPRLPPLPALTDTPRTHTRARGRVVVAAAGKGRGSDLLALQHLLELPLDPLHRDVSHLSSGNPLAAASEPGPASSAAAPAG